MTSPHTVALGSTGWEIWRDVIIRSAGFPVEGLQQLQDAPAAAAVDSALAAAATPQQLKALAEEALHRQLPTVERIATDPLLREAIAWQNPNVFHALGRVVPDGPRNSRYYQGVRTVGRYWQRYCSKNESIGFFGPATWARIDDDGPTVQARPGSGLLARRWTKLEDWALDALASAIAADPAVAPHLPVRIPSSVILTPPVAGSPATARAATGKPLQLSSQEQWLLQAADGRARSALVVDAVAAGAARTAGDADLTLRRLTERGLLSVGFDVRHVHDVADRLLADLQALPEPARAAALHRFDALDTARAALAAAAGDPTAVLAADNALKEVFRQQVSEVTERRPGETYAGRKLAYEDTARDLAVRFGPALVERIAAPMGLLLQAAHWWCAHLEATFTAAFGDLVDEMGDGRPMPLSDLLFLAQGLLWGEHNLVASQTDEFAGRWAELLGTAGAEPQDGLTGSIELSSADLAPEMDRLFPRLPLRWRAAHIHSPDLQIAANGLDALLAGEFTPVLGELHTGGGTFDSAATTLAHPHPDVLAEALTADIGSHRVHVLHADSWPRQLGRLSTVFDGPQDRYLPVAPEPVRGIAEPHFLPPGDALVVRDDQGVGVFHGGLRWSLIDVLADLLWIHTVDAFKMVTPARYTPRISIDGLVINRRSWRITCGETAFGRITDAPNRFVEARRLAAELHLPDRCYVKLGSEIKPFFVDLTSPVLADVFGCMVRSAVLAEGPQVTLSLSEALPDLEQNWLPDAEGRRYVCELRMQCVERDEFSTGPQAVPVTDASGVPKTDAPAPPSVAASVNALSGGDRTSTSDPAVAGR
ncbi:lantibiotic dehydratase [Nakamurella sp. A5-74]|uniref:Lantibiotic dehydratase n=1 Tax=Nakamurella sp. A5-74 TaxID=3158264 RepID=A0AAU8DPY4_9ACTN